MEDPTTKQSDRASDIEDYNGGSDDDVSECDEEDLAAEPVSKKQKLGIFTTKRAPNHRQHAIWTAMGQLEPDKRLEYGIAEAFDSLRVRTTYEMMC